MVFPGLLSACGVALGLSYLTDACVPRASDFNPTWLGSPSFSTTSLQLLFGPCHAERGWPSKDPSEPYWEVKQKHFCVQRGLGGVGTAIPSPLFLLHFQLLHHLFKLLLLGLQHLVKALKLLKRTREEEKSHGQQSAPEVSYRPSRPRAPRDAVQAGPYGSQLGATS